MACKLRVKCYDHARHESCRPRPVARMNLQNRGVQRSPPLCPGLAASLGFMQPAGTTHSVVTVGNFDGVHAGHVALVHRARRLADAADARVVVLSFDPHPISLLRPEYTPARLTTFDHRKALLIDAGADEVLRLEPSPELLGLSPAEFIDSIVAPLRPVSMVEGPDFRFGKARAGDIQVLQSLGAERGFGVEVVDPIAAVLGNQHIATASSTLVRTLLQAGRVTDAWTILGRPYRIQGTVERGQQRGRTIGMPTANVRPPTLMPADGVYAAVARILAPGDDRWWPAAVNVGARPTVGGAERRVEAHLIQPGAALEPEDFRPIEGLDEYGWELSLDLVGWIRDELKFPTFDALAAQIRRDVRRVEAVVRRRTEAA